MINKGRKTINVGNLIEFGNSWMQTEENEDIRIGIEIMVNEILHASGNYNGYDENDEGKRWFFNVQNILKKS